MTVLVKRIDRYSDLLYKAIRELNELHYNSLIDPDWKKSNGDYHRVAATILGLGIALENVVATFKILNKGGKE